MLEAKKKKRRIAYNNIAVVVVIQRDVYMYDGQSVSDIAIRLLFDRALLCNRNDV